MADPAPTPRPDAVVPDVRVDSTAADTAVSDVRDRVDSLSARAYEIWGQGFED